MKKVWKQLCALLANNSLCSGAWIWMCSGGGTGCMQGRAVRGAQTLLLVSPLLWVPGWSKNQKPGTARLWGLRWGPMSTHEQFGKGVKRPPSYKLCVISRLWTGRCIIVELLNHFPTLPDVLIYPPGSSSSVCSLLAMETPRMARPAQGSYNYLLTICLLTSSYNYDEFFLLKRWTIFPALWIYSLLPGRTKLAWFFYPVISIL